MAVKDDSIFCTQQFEVCFSFYFNFSGESFINKIVKITFYGNLTVNQWKETKHLREKLVTLRNYIADKCIWQSGPCMWLKDSECQRQHCCSVFVWVFAGVVWAWRTRVLVNLSECSRGSSVSESLLAYTFPCKRTWVKRWIWLNMTLCLRVYNKEHTSE